MRALMISVALLGLISISSADTLRSQVEASNRAITNAMKKKNFTQLAKLMKQATTKDFKYTEAGKSQSYDEMVSNMKTGLGMMNKLTTCSAQVLTLHRHGSTADGTIRHTMAGTVKSNDKKVHRMTFSGVSQDTYRLEGGKWKIASMTWKSQKETMDGKPVPSMGG